MGETYKSAGVDIEAGEEAVRRIKDKVRSTFRPEVIGDIGGFGGLFEFAQHRYHRPVLVSSTDGVGTKALVAQAAGRFDTIGVDLVAMCVDDLVCQGAEPLFFLDYISVGRVDPDHIAELVEGVAEGCRQAGCALIGGEMAEHPGAMAPGDFDLVGFAVGVAELPPSASQANIIDGDWKLAQVDDFNRELVRWTLGLFAVETAFAVEPNLMPLLVDALVGSRFRQDFEANAVSTARMEEVVNAEAHSDDCGNGSRTVF